MADIVVPEDLLLPLPTTENEKDLYNTLQDYTKKVGQSFSALEDIETITAGTGLTDTTNTFSVNVDGSTVEIGGSGIQVKNGGIDTTQLATDSVDKTIIDADVAGSGLVQAVGGELDVNVDNVTIEITTDVLGVKNLSIDTAQLTGKGVTTAKLEDDLVFGTFPSTPSSAPDANYEVANKKYVDDNSGANEYSVTGTLRTIHTNAAETFIQPTANVWTKMKESQCSLNGIMEVSYSSQCGYAHPAVTFTSRIYVNGVAVGTSHEVTNNDTYNTYSEDITVEANDLIQVYEKMSNLVGYGMKAKDLIFKSSVGEKSLIIL